MVPRGDERRTGAGRVIRDDRTGEAIDPWEIFFEGVEQLSDKFFASERVQPPLKSRD
jgi:hypothetical protein